MGMKYSVTMELHDAARLVRMEIRDFVLPRVVHCVLYCEHRLRLVLPIHAERKSSDSIFCHTKLNRLNSNRFGAGVYTSSAANK